MRKLQQADRMPAEGKGIGDVRRELQVSEQTYHRWRNQSGGLKDDDAKRLKEAGGKLRAQAAARRRGSGEGRAKGDPGNSEPGTPAGSRSPPHGR